MRLSFCFQTRVLKYSLEPWCRLYNQRDQCCFACTIELPRENRNCPWVFYIIILMILMMMSCLHFHQAYCHGSRVLYICKPIVGRNKIPQLNQNNSQSRNHLLELRALQIVLRLSD